MSYSEDAAVGIILSAFAGGILAYGAAWATGGPAVLALFLGAGFFASLGCMVGRD
jgi:hypothetical protein